MSALQHRMEKEMDWDKEQELAKAIRYCEFKPGYQKQKTGHTAKTTTCNKCGLQASHSIHSREVYWAVKAYKAMERDRDHFRLLFENVCDERRGVFSAIRDALPTLEDFSQGRPQLRELVLKPILREMADYNGAGRRYFGKRSRKTRS